jgi:hypothetical protein
MTNNIEDKEKWNILAIQILIGLAIGAFSVFAIALPMANSMTKGLSIMTDETSFRILHNKQSCLDAGYSYVDYQYTSCGFFGCAKGDFMGCNAIRNNPQCSEDGKICYNNGPSDALKCKSYFFGICEKWSID